MNDISKVILRTKTPYILTYLLEQPNKTESKTNIYKKTDVTYSHICKIIDKLEKNNIVAIEAVGRTKEVTLTKTGRQIAEHMDEILVKLKGLE